MHSHSPQALNFVPPSNLSLQLLNPHVKRYKKVDLIDPSLKPASDQLLLPKSEHKPDSPHLSQCWS